MEGKTEGAPTLWGKGIWNILKEETAWMRGKKIFHTITVRNGKRDLLSNLNFLVTAHLCPSKKTLERNLRIGKPCGDYVIILMDLDCQDETILKAEIGAVASANFEGRFSIHFATQEIESWMVADPNGFREVYKRYNTDCIVNKVTPLSHDPERPDCNPQISDRLKEAVEKCGEDYRKSIEGPQLLKAVNPSLVASKCSYFMRLRNDLRCLIEMPS